MRRWVFSAISLWGLSYALAFGEPRSEQGARLYQTRCAVCHGNNGDGRGPAAPSLNPKPTDLTSGLYKYRTTTWGSAPLDSNLERTIRNGLHGTAMPGFGDILSAEEIRAVIEVVKAFSPSTFVRTATPVTLPVVPLQDANAETGKALFIRKGCAQCHGVEGRGDGLLVGQLKDSREQRIRPRDLTDRRNYRWGATMQEIALRIAAGLNGTPMEGYADRMSPQEIQHLAAYLKSLDEEAEKTRWTGPTRPAEPISRGEYLARVMVCQLCHTPVNDDGSYREDLRFAGGMKVTSFPDGIYYSRNLTPDRESGLGDWSLEEITRAVTKGTSRHGGLLYPFDMPWLFFSNLTDPDALAIATYLKSHQPLYNMAPLPQPSGFFIAFWNKLRLLFGRERTLEYHAGNVGETNPEKGKTIPPATPGFWSLIPPMGWVPAEWILQAARPELPIPAPTGSPAEDAKRMHGRYLVSIAPCALCHTALQGSLWPKASAPLSGGMKNSWGGANGFGTVYARNLTPDSETGLGRWTDQQIKRAIRSGITKDGRMMHWQAMPWDIFSNFTEADLEAIVAYLRSLQPVRKSIPPPAPEANSGYFIYLGRDYGGF